MTPVRALGRAWVAAATALLVVAALVTWALRPSPRAGAALELRELLAGTDTSGYARALAPRRFTFPADHGPHPEFRTEWWYVTGNVTDASGARFGFQLPFFRSALAPAMPARGSAWATRQAYLAHFAVTDAAGRRFRAFERFARGAGGLAGARAEPLRVWVEDWSLEGGPGGYPLRLHAAEGDAAIDLELARGGPAVAQGDSGLSRKGPGPGNASYY